jgi:hypothetical protein
MAKYKINIEMTKKFHYRLQDQIFEHCEDFECWEDDMTYEESVEHCKRCDYYLLCQFSNKITEKIFMGEFK